MKGGATNDFRFFSILIILFVGAILFTSQPLAYAGVDDNDHDGYPSNFTCGGVNCDPDDNDPCNPDPDTQACMDRFLELVEDVEDVVADVQDLVDGGDFQINTGQLNALVGKLQQAADKIESEKFSAAIGPLNAFINQMNAFVNAGKISSTDAGQLIADAQAIINILS